MTDPTPGGRLHPLKEHELSDGARAVWDMISGTRPADVVAPDGSLVGPFNAFVTAPATGRLLAELGLVLRFDTSIDRRLTEIAIITTGARWKSEFEWWIHARMARDHGVPDDVIVAIANGEDTPPFTRDDERIVHAVAAQLGANGRIDPPSYEAGRNLLGARGMVELVSLCGFYTLISFLLNAFEVPLPEGAIPTWG